MKPHKRAEVIKAWADGETVQVSTPTGWEDMRCAPGWFDYNEYRIKPEPAAPKWPQTTMPPEAMTALHYNDPTHMDLWKFANGVIAHECSTGALVPDDKVREIEAKARSEGKREGMNHVHVIEAAWRHMKLGRLDPETIQIILLQASK